jgi:hypothetical protein
MLRIAPRPIDHLRRHLDRAAATVLPPTLAHLTDRDRDLIPRALRLGALAAIEHAPAQRREQRIMIELLAGRVGNGDARIPQQRQRLAADLEPDDMTARTRRNRRLR